MTQPLAPNLAPEAKDKPSLPWHEIPLVEATAESLHGFGTLVTDPQTCEIEIVRWPAQGWRPVDPDTGDQGGTTEGVFDFQWDGATLRAHNASVVAQNTYVLGWSCDPQSVTQVAEQPRERALMWHANYHPDGGQLFFPQAPGAFVAPLALPGDDVKPDDFVAFWFGGECGLYIHPGVWHDAVIPVRDRQRFYGRQGKVHARVSVDFGAEFGCYLATPLIGP